MEPVHVLLSAKITAAQIERMHNLHPRLVIDGEPGGYAIVDPRELDFRGLDYPEERSDVDVESLLARAEVLVATRIPGDVTLRAPNLRWIQVTSAGIDHLWQPCLDDSPIVVTSAKGIHAIPMSEFVLSCMLLFAKRVLTMVKQQSAHQWRPFEIQELHGKTVLLIGTGEIGAAVGRVAKQMGMKVIGVRRHPERAELPEGIDEVTDYDNAESALQHADYVVSSLPMTQRTTALIGEETFRSMKQSAVFINVGRGQTVDEQALVRALTEGWIAGAALDTFHEEPLPIDSLLWDLPNVLISPHMSADTPHYMERMMDLLCDNLQRYALGKPLRNVIDPIERY